MTKPNVAPRIQDAILHYWSLTPPFFPTVEVLCSHARVSTESVYGFLKQHPWAKERVSVEKDEDRRYRIRPRVNEVSRV